MTTLAEAEGGVLIATDGLGKVQIEHDYVRSGEFQAKWDLGITVGLGGRPYVNVAQAQEYTAAELADAEARLTEAKMVRDGLLSEASTNS